MRPRPAAGARAAARPRGFLAPRSLPILYLNMPKSGCTTIKNVLQRLDDGAFIGDPLTIHKRKDLLLRGDGDPEEIARRLGRDPVFTFVRHPLKRAYSCFCEKVHFQTPYSFPRVRAALAHDYGARFEGRPRPSCTGRTSRPTCASPATRSRAGTPGAATRTGARRPWC